MTVRTASRCCVALGTNRVPSDMRCGASVAIVGGTDGKGAVSASARSNGSDKASSNGTTNAARRCLTFWSATLSAWDFGTSSLAVRRRAARALISRVSNTPTMNAPTPQIHAVVQLKRRWRRCGSCRLRERPCLQPTGQNVLIVRQRELEDDVERLFRVDPWCDRFEDAGLARFGFDVGASRG